jgi:hypothetical protein
MISDIKYNTSKLISSMHIVKKRIIIQILNFRSHSNFEDAKQLNIFLIANRSTLKIISIMPNRC